VPDNIVLCYHALSATWDADLSVTPGRFEGQIRLLLERGYRAVRFSDAVRWTGRSRVFAITFDDGYRSVFDTGLPILTRLGVPATLFLPTDYIGTREVMRWPGIDRWCNGPFERELTPVSWDEVRSLAAAGWEIGSHSGSHARLTQLDDAALEDELARSKAACEEQLDGACSSLAYPYGDVDARVVAAAARVGYATAAALPRRLGSRDPLAWPRVGVYRADDNLRLRLKVSPTLRRLRRSGIWNGLDPVTALIASRCRRGRRSRARGSW
jgi:peptidoglycan/xylan/chitin deacetylase (PgdA/CDA1 family)